MKKKKRLTIALTFCGLALCIAVGALVYVYQENREQGECLTAAQRQIETLETQLSQATKEMTQMEERLALAEEARAEAEKERDNAQRQYEWATKRDNPIDRYLLSSNRTAAFSTYEVSMEAWFEYEAWKREFEYALVWVEKDCGTVYEEDRQLLNDYQAAIEAQAKTMNGLTYLHIAESFPPEERWGRIGSWGGCAVSYAEAEVYRQGVIHLLDTYAYAMAESNYPYSFDEEVRKGIIEEITTTTNNESVRETLEHLFPPISQVLPDQS